MGSLANFNQLQKSLRAETIAPGAGTPAVPEGGDYHWTLDDLSGVLVNTGTSSGGDITTVGTVEYQKPSLRFDGTGKTIRFPGSSNIYADITLPLVYQDGITIEAIVKTDSTAKGLSFDVTKGRVAAGLYSNSNISNDSLWTLRFDNFNNSSVDETTPTFGLLKRATIYSLPTNYATGLEAEVRGNSPIALGSTHHILATIRPSDNTIELWVDGVSLGTDAIPIAWYGTGADNVLDGSKSSLFRFGDPYLNGQFKAIDATYDEVKIHLLEADQAFADKQFSLAKIPFDGAINYEFDENLANNTTGSVIVEKAGGTANNLSVVRPGGLGDITYNKPSLKGDGTGTSIQFTSVHDSAYMNTSTPDTVRPAWKFNWSNGMTVEYLVKVNHIHDGTSFSKFSYAGYIDFNGDGITRNSDGYGGFFQMGFDNLYQSNKNVLTLKPAMRINDRNDNQQIPIQSFGSAAEFSKIEGSTTLTIGKTYHMMATIRPSNNTAEFWVDGVSQGTAPLETLWFTPAAGANNDLLLGEKELYPKIGRSLSGLEWLGDHVYDNFKIHLREADQGFVTAQYNEAAGVVKDIAAIGNATLGTITAIGSSLVASGNNSATAIANLGGITADAVGNTVPANITWSGTRQVSSTDNVGPLEAGIRFNTDGTISKDFDTAFTFLENYLQGSNAGSNYEVKFTLLSGTSPTTGGILVDGITWHNLGTSRLISNEKPSGIGTISSLVEAVIRPIGDTTNENTGTVTIRTTILDSNNF